MACRVCHDMPCYAVHKGGINDILMLTRYSDFAAHLANSMPN